MTTKEVSVEIPSEPLLLDFSMTSNSQAGVVLETSPDSTHFLTMRYEPEEVSDQGLVKEKFSLLIWKLSRIENVPRIEFWGSQSFQQPNNCRPPDSIAISNGGRYVAFCWLKTKDTPKDAKCKIFKVSSDPKQSWTRVSFENSNYGIVSFLPDDNLILANQNVVALFDPHRRGHIHRDTHTHHLVNVEPLGFVTSHRNDEIIMDDEELLTRIHIAAQFSLICIDRGILFSVIYENKILQVWSLYSGQLLASIRCGLSSNRARIALSSDSRFIAVYSWDGWVDVKVYYLDNAVLVGTFQLNTERVAKNSPPIYFDFVDDDKGLVLLRHSAVIGQPLIFDKWDFYAGYRVETVTDQKWDPNFISELTFGTYVDGNLHIVDEDSEGNLAITPFQYFIVLNQESTSLANQQIVVDGWLVLCRELQNWVAMPTVEFTSDYVFDQDIWSFKLNDLIIRCGVYSLQIWETTQDGSSKNLSKLLFIWCPPEKRYLDRSNPRLEDYHKIKWEWSDKDDEVKGRPSLKLLDNNRLEITIEGSEQDSEDVYSIDIGNPLAPRECDRAEYAAHALALLRCVKIKIGSTSRLFVDTIANEVKDILRAEIKRPKGHFSSVKGGQSLAELLRACADDPYEESLVKSVLEDVPDFKPWIYINSELYCCQAAKSSLLLNRLLPGNKNASPTFHENHSHELESVLSAAVDYERTESVRALGTWILFTKWHQDPGYISAFMSVMAKLCRNYPDILEVWWQNMNYMPASPVHIYPFIESQKVGKAKGLHLGRNQRAKIANLFAFGMTEQLEVSNNKQSYYSPIVLLRYIDRAVASIYESLVSPPKIHAITICSMPFFSFTSYTVHRVDPSTGMLIVKQKSKSDFAKLALDGYGEIFGVEMLEAALLHSWHYYARQIWLGIFAMYFVYYFLFLICILDDEIFGGNKAAQTILLIILLFVAGTLLIQEVRQMFSFKLEYIKSVYNWIDIAAYGLPFAASALKLVELWAPNEYAQLAKNYSSYDIKSIATFILWIHMLQQLRVVKGLGILIATVIEIGKRVFWMIFLQLVIVMAFGHALHVLISVDNGFDDDYFAQQSLASGPANLSTTNNQPITGTVSLTSGDETSNGFRTFYYAFRTVWFFSSGDWGPADGIKGSLLLEIFVGIYSCVVVIVLLNILIAMINDVFSDTRDKGQKVWLRMFAEIIAEIETSWATDTLRQNKNYHPTILYYVGSTDIVNKWRNDVDQSLKDAEKQ